MYGQVHLTIDFTIGYIRVVAFCISGKQLLHVSKSYCRFLWRWSVNSTMLFVMEWWLYEITA